MADDLASAIAARAGRALRNHVAPCPEAHEAGELCARCGWDGESDGESDAPREIFWGIWYADDVADCDVCGALALPVSCGYYDDVDAICLRCVVADHARDCGCDRWRATEEALGVERDAARRDGR